MANDLARYTSGQQVTPRTDRAVTAQAKAHYDEVRLRGFMIDGAYALAEHIQRRIAQLHQETIARAAGDIELAIKLGAIELAALQKATEIQASLYTDSGSATGRFGL